MRKASEDASRGLFTAVASSGCTWHVRWGCGATTRAGSELRCFAVHEPFVQFVDNEGGKVEQYPHSYFVNDPIKIIDFVTATTIDSYNSRLLYK